MVQQRFGSHLLSSINDRFASCIGLSQAIEFEPHRKIVHIDLAIVIYAAMWFNKMYPAQIPAFTCNPVAHILSLPTKQQNMKTFSILAAAAALLLTLPAQAQSSWKTITGEGQTVKEQISLDDFHSIGLGIAGTVYVQPGKTRKVTIEAQKNIIDNIKREVKNGSWNISFHHNARNYSDVKIYITMPTVQALSIGGSGKIISTEAFNNLGDLSFSIGGSGNIEFSGDANSLKVSIGGSGSVKAGNLKVGSSKVSIGGSGSCYVEVGDRLDVSIAGSGSVHYKGRPKINSSIAGSGKVITID